MIAFNHIVPVFNLPVFNVRWTPSFTFELSIVFRDRKPENQSYRTSGLTLLTAAISLWNTVYMERAVDALKRKGLKRSTSNCCAFVAVRLGAHQSDRLLYLENNQIPASGKFRRLRAVKVEKSKNSLNEWKGLPVIMRLINSCAIMGYTSSRRNSL